VRRCPYCAEDIEDDTQRCPYCGSDLRQPVGGAADGTAQPVSTWPGTTPVPAPAAGPAWGGQQGPVAPPTSAPAPGSIQFSHTGQRYLLGYDATDFGIWDRSAPGGAVERFPRSDDGWSEAWRRYASLEPNSQPVRAVQAPTAAQQQGAWQQGQWQQPQPGVYHVPQVSTTNGLSVAALVLGLAGLATFWLFAVPPVLALIFGILGLGQIRRSGGREQGDGMAIAGIVLGSIGIVFFVIMVINFAVNGIPE